MRHAATHALLSRRDVIIVASVSCIYGIGDRESYMGMTAQPRRRGGLTRDHRVLRRLVEMQYERNDVDFHRGTFRVRGDVVEIFPPTKKNTAIRVEWFGDTDRRPREEIDPLRAARCSASCAKVTIYPNSHYVTPSSSSRRRSDHPRRAPRIRVLDNSDREVHREGADRAAHALRPRDARAGGLLPRHRELLAPPLGPRPGEAPPTLIDYFPPDFLLMPSTSRTRPSAGRRDVPRRPGAQGDAGRVRLPPAERARQPAAEVRGVRAAGGAGDLRLATPGDYELETGASFVEQVIRPTGLIDPADRGAPRRRARSTTCSPRSASASTERGDACSSPRSPSAWPRTSPSTTRARRPKVRYLHSDVDTLERIEILRDLRRGEFDVLVGINLLREGLDLPEVSLVAILDADKEGFLRSPLAHPDDRPRRPQRRGPRHHVRRPRHRRDAERGVDETDRRHQTSRTTTRPGNITPATVRSARDRRHQPRRRATATSAPSARRRSEVESTRPPPTRREAALIEDLRA